MKFKMIFYIFSIFFLSCQNSNKQSEAEIYTENDSLVKEDQDSSKISQQSPHQPQVILALTSNALQMVKLSSGSTIEIKVGMEMDKVLGLVSNVLESEIPEPQVNSECGAGPMTMAIFKNGLVLMFQKAKVNAPIMEFVGWSISENDKSDIQKLTTMANIGIGSTRAELESAYNVEIKKTSLGIEFSTVPEGLYGILDGPLETSKINFMWSGASCNFR